MLCITTFALSLQSPAPLSRRAVFSGAAAAAVPLAAKAFDLPALEEFDDMKARAKAAKMPNPSLRKQQSSAFYAVSTFDQGSLEKMIEGGWDLAGAKDEAGKTVLHRAAQVGNTPAVEALLKSGVNIDAVTQWKETPLHMAARNNRLAVVKTLVEAGASTTSKTYGGDTALEIATKYKFKDLVSFLDSK